METLVLFLLMFTVYILVGAALAVVLHEIIAVMDMKKRFGK